MLARQEKLKGITSSAPGTYYHVKPCMWTPFSFVGTACVAPFCVLGFLRKVGETWGLGPSLRGMIILNSLFCDTFRNRCGCVVAID